ncbi:extracellular solute-binding protein [Lactococcus termiticola]|uniref:Putative periplasmic-iron-binding protein n=1 Tax=Lactococcus termiticola TaxID=2169526 RepID=A0A2R5HIR0_9LACT|nr:extracellular solute-binding protein [Lactococcus termiticola]GBG96258.1 putative periplasmic-iron-binding protein [Lactococcus termiticola]
MNFKKIITTTAIISLSVTGLLALSACSSSKASKDATSGKEVVIYTNADKEAETVMKKTLDDNGYKGAYKFVDFGSADLNTKVNAEGTNLQADLVTLSTFYIDSAQKSKDMFADWKTPGNLLDNFKQEGFQSPILGLEGSLMVNTAVLKSKGLAKPSSIKDLTKPEYKGLISFPSLETSTTGWLMVQALISKYGEVEAQNILTGLIKNAGAHLTSSGSAPVQDVTSGQVAVAFGLRQQGVEAQKQGQPIEVINASEGNYVLTESVAVVKHKDIKDKTEKIAEVLATKTRKDLMGYYPPAIFKGEQESNNESLRGEYFDKPLSTDLLKSQIQIFEKAKAAAN